MNERMKRINANMKRTNDRMKRINKRMNERLIDRKNEKDE